MYNGLTDLDHPTQILADMLTIEEHLHKPLKEVKVVFPGDVRNNMCYAWMYGCAKMGMHFVGCGPKELINGIDQKIYREALDIAAQTGAKIEITDDLACVKGADVIYGDIWASMGEEDLIPERAKMLAPFKVTMAMMKQTGNKDVLYLHCLPSFHDMNTTFGKMMKEKAWISARSRTRYSAVRTRWFLTRRKIGCTRLKRYWWRHYDEKDDEIGSSGRR